MQRHQHNGTGAYLPSFSTNSGLKTGRHQEAFILPVAKPAGKTRQRAIPKMLFVYKYAANTARARVHVFVGAPAGKIYIPIVQVEFYIPGGVCQVKTCD